MNTTLNVVLVQTDLVWEYPEQNRLRIAEKIKDIPKGTELIILPEMFTSGFTMNASSVAETMDGTTISWMHSLAKANQSAITGSLIIEENGAYYNRLIFITPDGNLYAYNKRHTFTLAGEHKVYTAGTKKVIIEYKGWRICPMICYDLRFPVWSRNSENYDLLLYVANWPKPRISAWDALLKARAIENMSYCIGVNRVGFDGNGHEYPGHSAAYDVLGHRLDDIIESTEQGSNFILDKYHLSKYRNKLGFLKDRDGFNLKG